MKASSSSSALVQRNRRRTWLLILGVLAGGGVLLGIVTPRHQDGRRPSDNGAPNVPLAESGSKPLSAETRAERLPVVSKQSHTSTKPDTTTTLQEQAIEYQKGLSNIFFDEVNFLSRFAAGGRQKIDAVSSELRKCDGLSTLPLKTSFMESKPRVFAERMAMIDLMGGYLQHDLGPDKRRAALDGLTDVVRNTIPTGSSDVMKRALVSEKYESLQLLAQTDREQAFLLISEMRNPKLKQQLLPALVAGLRRAGLDEQQALSAVANL